MSMKINKQLTFTMYEANIKFATDPMKILFDNIDFSFIYPMVKPYYKPRGRKSFDPVSIFKALLFIYMDLKISSERQLAKHLKYDLRLLTICGFDDILKTPSHATFSKFRSNIGDETFFEIFHNLVSQAFLLRIISGQITATDSSHLWAYSNKFGKKLCTCKDKAHCNCPKTYSDPDASWGKKSKDYSFFGYKVNLIVDVKSQLPISISVTTGKSSDSSQSHILLNQLKQKHSDIKVEFNVADAAYDTHRIYQQHKDFNIIPIIDINQKNNFNPLLSKEIKFTNGKLYCRTSQLYYSGFDSQRNRAKFRCPLALGKINQCKFSSQCCKTAYGRTFYIHPTDDIRLFPPVSRFSNQWKSLYNHRSAVERTISELKSSHALKNLRFKSLSKVSTHVYMSCIALVLKRLYSFLYQTTFYKHSYTAAFS